MNTRIPLLAAACALALAACGNDSAADRDTTTPAAAGPIHDDTAPPPSPDPSLHTENEASVPQLIDGGRRTGGPVQDTAAILRAVGRTGSFS